MKGIVRMHNCSAIGIDIDGVITASPEYFSALTGKWRRDGKVIHVVSSRSDQLMARTDTISELRHFGIVFDHLYLLPSIEVAQQMCPHIGLDWFQKYIWQKVDYCIKYRIGIFYDDAKVVELFKALAPEIDIIHYKSSLTDGRIYLPS